MLQQANNMRTGIIYKYTNMIHEGFAYIGQTIFNKARREGLDCNRYEKCIVFYRAIEKYGIENFKYEILEKDIPEDALDERERYWIAFSTRILATRFALDII